MVNHQDVSVPVSNSLTVFKFDTQQVRVVVGNDGNPWFVAKDVCTVLDIKNVPDAVSRLDLDEFQVIDSSAIGLNDGNRINNLSEAGLYSLILGSRKPQTKAFKRWVTHEVLPSIRKTGSYSIQQQHKLPHTYLEALKELVVSTEKLSAVETKLIEAQPKVDYHDAVHKAENCHTFLQAAKILKIGRNTLTAKLRDKNILMSDFGRRNVPYQSFMNSGYFRVKQSIRNGHMNYTTYITGKGMIWLEKTLAKE